MERTSISYLLAALMLGLVIGIVAYRRYYAEVKVNRRRRKREEASYQATMAQKAQSPRAENSAP